MKDNHLDKTILALFTGSDTCYRHGLARNIVYTEGAKYIADTAGAYWLLDDIAFAQLGEAAVSAEEFQVWRLAVNDDGTATLTCEDGNGRTVYTKALEFTDFPQEGVTLWFANRTIYLPTEH